MSTDTFFILGSDTSRHSTQGLSVSAYWHFKDKIIEWAQKELFKAGSSFEELAGIELVEDEDGMLRHQREANESERFNLSVEKLGDDGRLFCVFETTEEGALRFIEAASEYGENVKQQAQNVIAEYFGIGN